MSTEKMVDRTTYPAVVGQILAKRREVVGLEQTAMAARMGLSQPTWSRIEHGQSALSIEKLAKTAAILETTPGRILQEADEAAEGLRKMNVVVDTERPDQASNTALVVLGGAVLAFLIAKALAK